MIKDWKITKLISRKRLIIIALAFFVWLAFFDDYSLLKRIETMRERAKVQREIDNYNADIARTQALIEALDSCSNSVEQFARENYHMKAPDEDVYLIKEND